MANKGWRVREKETDRQEVRVACRFSRHLFARQGAETAPSRFPEMEARCKKDTSHMLEAFSRVGELTRE